ncbi:MAG: shikimate kinase [Clostridiales bacterium]|nr:MAG: shikimate kinase [Clostridiales bacterium]
MKKRIVHVFGASGAGTSTLGRALTEYGYTHLDTDDYYWKPTDPMFLASRPKEERVQLLARDIAGCRKCSITGSLTGWGDVFIPQFTLAVWLLTSTNLRIERLERREYERFGERICPGGDMYEEHIRFIEWAKTYDTAIDDSRNRLTHTNWSHLLQCPLIVLDGSRPVEQLVQSVLATL